MQGCASSRPLPDTLKSLGANGLGHLNHNGGQTRVVPPHFGHPVLGKSLFSRRVAFFARLRSIPT
jgi:hypothetical protein